MHRLSLDLGDCWVWAVSASALLVTASSVVPLYRVIKLLHRKEWETLETKSLGSLSLDHFGTSREN